MIIKHDFYYPPADSMRMLHIYLPDDYYETEEKYPVMYYFDGHNLFYDSDATYGTCWGLKDYLDHWDKKMIVVGMECSHVGNERLNEYSPYTKKMFGCWIQGIGDQTFQWIEHDIKPWVDENFRTWSHREATGLCGSSMGGLMTVYGLIRYNHIFSKGAALSTGVFRNISMFRRDLASSYINEDTRLYMSWGELEVGKAAYNGNNEFDSREARATRKFEQELQERGFSTYVYFQKEGKHCEADWAKQNHIYLNFLWK